MGIILTVRPRNNLPDARRPSLAVLFSPKLAFEQRKLFGGPLLDIELRHFFGQAANP